MLSIFKRTIFLILVTIAVSNLAYSQEIFTAVINGDFSKVQAILNSNKEAVNSEKANGNTPLHIAADNGHLDIVKLLISFGADIDKKNNGNRSPLFYAMRSDHMDIVRLFVDNGGEITINEAATCGFIETIEEQIAKGVDPNTLLHSAAFGGQKDIVELLINNGADVNLKDGNSEFTPIFYAIIKNHEMVIDILIKNGADLNAKDKNGDSPLDIAKSVGNDLIIGKLTNLGAQSTLGPEANIFRLAQNIYRINFPISNKPNIIVLVGEEKTLMFDTGFGRNVERLSNIIKELGNGKLQYIINTHLHEDHTGGNFFFNGDVEFINYTKLKDLASKGIIKQSVKETDSVSLDCFPLQYSMSFDFENLFFIPAAGTHSASDMIIRLNNSNIVVLGDILLPPYFQKENESYEKFLERRRKTIISKGVDHLNIIDRIISSFSVSSIFIGGHGDQFGMDDIKEYYRLAKDILSPK